MVHGNNFFQKSERRGRPDDLRVGNALGQHCTVDFETKLD